MKKSLYTIRLSGYTVIRLSGYPVTRLSGYPVIRLPGYLVIRLSGYSVIRLPGYPVIRLPGYPVIRLSTTRVFYHAIKYAYFRVLLFCTNQSFSASLNITHLAGSFGITKKREFPKFVGKDINPLRLMSQSNDTADSQKMQVLLLKQIYMHAACLKKPNLTSARYCAQITS